MRWQPISTSPQDGSGFLVKGYIFPWTDITDVKEACWRLVKGDELELDYGDCGYEITDWMPFPSDYKPKYGYVIRDSQ
jgi:hypothetical protein